MHEKHPDSDTALGIVQAERLPILKKIFGVEFDPAPVGTTRLEIGWLFEFAPIDAINENGRKIYHVQFIVDDFDGQVHPVGTPGVDRAIERIKRGRQRGTSS